MEVSIHYPKMDARNLTTSCITCSLLTMLQNNIMEFDILMEIYRKNIDTFPEIIKEIKAIN